MDFRYILFFLIALDLNLFDLIDPATFRLFGIISYYDLKFLIIGTIACISCMRMQFKHLKVRNVSLVVIFTILAIMSAASGAVSYNQSLLDGLVAQREWFAGVMLIIPVSIWISYGYVSKTDILNIVKKCARIYAAICIAQYIFGESVVFTYASVGERYGEARYYLNINYFIFSFSIIVNELYNSAHNSKVLLFKIFEITVYAFIIIWITKGRMATVALLLSCSCIFIFRGHVDWRKRILIIELVVLLIIAFGYSTVGKDILNTLNASSSEISTLDIRDFEREYYTNRINSSLRTQIFGYGYPNANNSFALRISNPIWFGHGDAKFYLSDVGITGVAFEYGAIGVLVLVATTIYMIYKSISMYISTHTSIYIQYLVYDTITWVSLVPALFDTSFVAYIMICVILSDESLPDEMYKTTTFNKGLL